MTIREVNKLLRLPNLLAVIAFQSLIQFVLVIPYLTEHDISVELPLKHFILLVVATVCIQAGGNIINDYFDINTDRINRPDTIVVGKSLDRRIALMLHVIFSLIGVFAGLYLSFLLQRSAFMALFIIVPLLLWFYSTHFKKQILIGNMVVALFIALTGYMVVSVDYTIINRTLGYSTTKGAVLSHLWYVVCAYSLFAFISNLAREIIKDMEDVDGDKATGCRTLSVELGFSLTKLVVIAIEIFMIIMLIVAYFDWEDLHHSQWGLPYIGLLIVFPTLFLCYQVWKCKDKKDYKRASTLSKIIMMFGMASMFII